MTTSIRIKHRDKGHSIGRGKVAEITYNKLQVPLTRIFSTNEGFKVICKDDFDSDKILSKEARDIFYNEGLIVVMPPEQKAKRSVFVRQVDQEIGRKT